MVLFPETFKRLDHSKHTQVVTCHTCPCDWSLLPSTVLTCVLFCHACSDTHAQVFQESPGVPSTPQLVPPPQDCCVFQLVPLCTISMVEAVSRCVWPPPLLNACCAHNMCSAHGPGWHSLHWSWAHLLIPFLLCWHQ